MCIEEPRAHRPFGNPEDFCDLRMRHALDIEHRHHRTMIGRKLEHRFIQALLEFAEIRLPFHLSEVTPVVRVPHTDERPAYLVHDA